MSFLHKLFPVLTFAVTLSLPASAQQSTVTPMVAAAEPEAVEAGLRVLERGGTAIDAAIAVQATLSLVEPQSSGVGGGGFLIYYDAARGEVTAVNGRETAPASADERRFYDEDGNLLRWPDAVTSGRATGVP